MATFSVWAGPSGELLRVSRILAGTSGTYAPRPGTTALEAGDAGPVPIELVAVTVKVYAVPSVRPLTVALSVPPPTAAFAPPGLAVTV